MKKNPAASSSPPAVARARPGFLWPAIAVASLVANVVLATLWWRGVEARRSAEAAAAAHAEAVRSGGLRAYAALGSFMAENNRIAALHWTAEQFDAFQDGFRASYEGRGVPLGDEARALQAKISERVQAMIVAERPDPAEEYFKTLREKEGVTRTSSGLHYRITEPGFGPTAAAGDTVVLSFAARRPDGEALPSFSRVRMRTAVKDLLPGLAEGVQLMRVGGKALIYLPPALAFADDSWPPEIPRGMPVAFFVELHEIVGR